jgi:hypothetical protein
MDLIFAEDILGPDSNAIARLNVKVQNRLLKRKPGLRARPCINQCLVKKVLQDSP